MREETDRITSVLVRAKSRPLRVAFLIDPERATENEFEQIVRFACNAWGGRYYPIIPTNGDSIQPDWLNLLLAVDPDAIFSFHPVSPTLKEKVTRQTNVVEFVEVADGVHSQNGSSSVLHELRADPLSIDPVVAAVQKYERFSDGLFFYIREEGEKGRDYSFILRNFGSLYPLITTNVAFEAVFHRIIPAGGSTSAIEFLNQTSVEALSDIARASATDKRWRHLRPIFPLDLAGKLSGNIGHIRYSAHHEGIHIVVGNSPHDFIYAWNRVLLTNSTERHTLWVPDHLATDDNFIAQLASWLKGYVWNFGHNKTNKVVSYSSMEHLGRIAATLQNALHLTFVASQQPDLNFRGADRRSLTTSGFSVESHVPLSNRSGLVQTEPPPLDLGLDTQGHWMVDLQVAMPSDPAVIRAQSFWTLPQRPGLARLFSPHANYCRIGSSGHPSIAVNSKSRVLPLKLPDRQEIALTCLLGEYWHSEPESTRRFIDFAPSANGSYLHGLLGLFGGVHSSGRTFENPYWRDVLGFMANEQAPFGRTMTVRQLARNRARLRRRFDTEQGEGALIPRDMEEVCQWVEQFMEWAVFLQGAVLKCPNCGTKDWYGVESLGATIQCHGCLYDFIMPPAPEWAFRLNTLVLNAIRRDGVIPVVQCLYGLETRYREMFAWFLSQDVYERDNPQRYTDLDIVAIRDGRFIIGEVKSNPASLKRSDLDHLEAVALEVVPDEVVVAAPGEHWPAQQLDLIGKLEKRLSERGIKLSPILMQWL
ncbi:MAG: hypothetical protein ACJ8GN_28655 [Longimicrobiaceae bacterium]